MIDDRVQQQRYAPSDRAPAAAVCHQSAVSVARGAGWGAVAGGPFVRRRNGDTILSRAAPQAHLDGLTHDSELSVFVAIVEDMRALRYSDILIGTPVFNRSFRRVSRSAPLRFASAQFGRHSGRDAAVVAAQQHRDQVGSFWAIVRASVDGRAGSVIPTTPQPRSDP